MKGPTPSSAFWSLDLSKRNSADFSWTVLPTWPGPARIVPVAAAQRVGKTDTFFLFSGRLPHAGQPTALLRDAFAFDPTTNRWRTLPAIGGGKDGVSAMAGTAAAFNDEILLFGGDRGDLFLELESHDLAIAQLRTEGAGGSVNAQIEHHLQAKKKIYESHPGFSREVLAFNPRTNAWRTAARAPMALPVTTLAVQHRGAVIIPSGEVRPGVRTPEILRIRLETRK
jgi:solute:Na+ symporter, SSS family